MDALPQDSLLQIFQDLNIYQIVNLQMSCKRFRDVIDKHNHLWRNLCLKDYSFLFHPYPFLSHSSFSYVPSSFSSSTPSSMQMVPAPSTTRKYFFSHTPSTFKELYIHEHKLKHKWYPQQVLKHYDYYYPFVKEITTLCMIIGPILSLFMELPAFRWMVLQLVFVCLSLVWSFQRINFHMKLSYKVIPHPAYCELYRSKKKPQYLTLYQQISFFYYLVTVLTALMIFVCTFPDSPISVSVIISFVPLMISGKKYRLPIPRIIIPLLFQLYVVMNYEDYISPYLLLSWKTLWTLIVPPLGFLVFFIISWYSKFKTKVFLLVFASYCLIYYPYYCLKLKLNHSVL